MSKAIESNKISHINVTVTINLKNGSVDEQTMHKLEGAVVLGFHNDGVSAFGAMTPAEYNMFVMRLPQILNDLKAQFEDSV